MSPTAFDFIIDGGVATLTLDTPQTHNALARAFWSDIKEVFAYLAGQDAVRVVVIKATGKHFSSGIDKAMLSSLFADRPDLEDG
ncbi:MAG: enoyl-CoA hydratase/isomerase family protein, partial [Kordiimonadaceae bacterium]|nr:enoyl-CoA hydratase/isomerase family protein [Kordiimonadaceae bacterium]